MHDFRLYGDKLKREIELQFYNIPSTTRHLVNKGLKGTREMTETDKIDLTAIKYVPKIDLTTIKYVPKIDLTAIKYVPKIDLTAIKYVPKIDLTANKYVLKIDLTAIKYAHSNQVCS